MTVRNTFLSFLSFLSLTIYEAHAASPYDNPDTLVVSRDGTAEFRNVNEAIEVCRAFMDYHKVIFVKKGVYKEKVIIPQWLTNIEICGEDRDETVITWDDHANIPVALALSSSPLSLSQTPAANGKKPTIGTFRTYTLKIQGSHITLKNITVENNAPRLGQAVALHTEGDCLTFLNCRFLGNQDTIYTGNARTRLFFNDCYIEGTTDFIFGPSTAWFEQCVIHCKADSYITAASTPKDIAYGYIFNKCRITTAPGVDNVYLGRPWRDYGYTLFMNCQLPRQIRPEGWHQWRPEAVKTARYMEYDNSGDGAATGQRVPWSRQLTKKEAQQITLERVFTVADTWKP
jgi:pectin methylesterase-like acyl-CoA thioesterase